MAEEQSILTPHQKGALDVIAGEEYFTDRYYFTGGTALAEFYLKHRFSEDLDFFTEKQEVNTIHVTRFFETKKSFLGLEKIDTRKVLGLYSLFLHFQDQSVLKVDFSYYPFPRIERGIKLGKLEVNSIYDIAVDKVHTVALNPRARDFIDLFFIIGERGYNFKDLLINAKAKFDWDITAIELGTRLLEAAKQTDYPRMVKEIDHKEWRDFFVNEAVKLKGEIISDS